MLKLHTYYLIGKLTEPKKTYAKTKSTAFIKRLWIGLCILPIFLCCPFTTSAQVKPTSENSTEVWPLRDIMAVQSGSIDVTSAKTTVKLNASVSGWLKKKMRSSYIVTFTPVGTFVPVTLVEKSNDAFTIEVPEPKDGQIINYHVDYMLFIEGNKF